MDLVRCSKGHLYDQSVTKQCPQCAAEAGRPGYSAEPPTPDYGETQPVNNGFANGGADWMADTKPVTGGFDMQEMGTNSRGGAVEDYDATTPVSMNGIAGFAPVTGWLVCIDGPARGTDYRIHTDYNFIGRDENMDICIRGDQRIDRDRHAVIVYDPLERQFFFGPQNAKTVVRLNGKPVIGQAELKEQDVLTIGSTKLIFVPLCGERFNWDE